MALILLAIAGALGEQVTVSGDVGEVFQLEPAPGAGAEQGGVAFTVGAETEEPLLVIDAGANARGFHDEGNLVQVTGTVRMFELNAFEKDFDGWLFDSEAFAEFEGQSVIVASSIDPTVPSTDSES